MNELQDEIRATVNLGKMAPTGFYPVRCLVCNDRKTRAGFKFESNGDVVYNCFRGKCDASSVYNNGEPMTNKFKRVMEAFNIDIPTEVKKAYVLKRKQTHTKETYDENLFEKHYYDVATLPDGVVAYDPDKHPVVKDYLSDRNLTPTELYIGTKGYWGGRLLVPFYQMDKLIGWQGVSVHKNSNDFLRYEVGGGNTDLLYFPDRVLPKEPIIVEGIFDAMSVPDGVATLGPTLTKKQAYVLRNCNPILLPDRGSNRFLDIAKKYGWRVCIPKYKEKDANQALEKYGRLALALHLRENVIDDWRKAETKYKLWKVKHGS